MARGSSRIFREKVSSAASALGVSGGVDFRRAGSVFIDRVRDAYADLGFSVGAAGRSSKLFREQVELANNELGISPVPAFSQTFSIDFDGVNEDMGGGNLLVGIADVFSIGGWVNFGNTLGRQDTWWTIEGGAGGDMALFQRSNVGAAPSFQFFGNGNNLIIPSLPITAATWHHCILTWNTNSDVKLYVDGSQFGGPLSGVGVFSDDAGRMVQVGDASTGVPNGLMKAANLAIWTTILGATEVATLFNAGSINIDLRVDQGNYASSATLEHFWPLGKDPSPLLGQDLGVGTLINLEQNAVGITDADRVADVP